MEPSCPHCDTRQEPERLAPGLYLCPTCAREFTWPVEPLPNPIGGLVGELLSGEFPTVQPFGPPLRQDQIEALRAKRRIKSL